MSVSCLWREVGSCSAEVFSSRGRTHSGSEFVIKPRPLDQTFRTANVCVGYMLCVLKEARTAGENV